MTIPYVVQRRRFVERKKIEAFLSGVYQYDFTHGIGTSGEPRKSDVTFCFPAPAVVGPIESLVAHTAQAMSIAVDGHVEPYQLARYHQGGFYEWHNDSDLVEYRERKLTAILMLADAEGGALELATTDFAKPYVVDMHTGDVIVFPSTLWHRVRRVTTGTRLTLTGWFTGPEWR